MKRKRFVRLRDRPYATSQAACSEYELACRELSQTGVYRVFRVEQDLGETFYLLVGGRAWYSATLFDEVPL